MYGRAIVSTYEKQLPCGQFLTTQVSAPSNKYMPYRHEVIRYINGSSAVRQAEVKQQAKSRKMSTIQGCHATVSDQKAAHHAEREDGQSTTSNCSKVHSVGCAVVANQLHTSIDVAVQPVDLNTGIGSNQKTNKGGSEDTIAVEVPVIAEPYAAGSNQSVPEVGDQQAEGLPVITCSTQQQPSASTKLASSTKLTSKHDIKRRQSTQAIDRREHKLCSRAVLTNM